MADPLAPLQGDLHAPSPLANPSTPTHAAWGMNSNNQRSVRPQGHDPSAVTHVVGQLAGLQCCHGWLRPARPGGELLCV